MPIMFVFVLFTTICRLHYGGRLQVSLCLCVVGYYVIQTVGSVMTVAEMSSLFWACFPSRLQNVMSLCVSALYMAFKVWGFSHDDHQK